MTKLKSTRGLPAELTDVEEISAAPIAIPPQISANTVHRAQSVPKIELPIIFVNSEGYG